MSIPAARAQILDFFGTPLVREPAPGQLSRDAGLLPIRQVDQRSGLTWAFADSLDDPRDPDLTEHTFLEMVRARVCGTPAGFEYQNAPDHLRADSVFKVVADRSPGRRNGCAGGSANGDGAAASLPRLLLHQINRRSNVLAMVRYTHQAHERHRQWIFAWASTPVWIDESGSFRSALTRYHCPCGT